MFRHRGGVGAAKGQPVGELSLPVQYGANRNIDGLRDNQSISPAQFGFVGRARNETGKAARTPKAYLAEHNIVGRWISVIDDERAVGISEGAGTGGPVLLRARVGDPIWVRAPDAK